MAAATALPKKKPSESCCAHGRTDANITETPNGEEYFEVLDEDAMLLETTSASSGQTVKVFQSLVGTLLWVARCTQPNVAFAVT